MTKEDTKTSANAPQVTLDDVLNQLHRYKVSTGLPYSPSTSETLYTSDDWIDAANELNHDIVRATKLLQVYKGQVAALAAQIAVHTGDDFEEGEYTSCASLLSDWWNGANIQGVACMQDVEFDELIKEMARLEGLCGNGRCAELEAELAARRDLENDLEVELAALQAKVDQSFTKKEIRVVLTEAYWYSADPDYQVDMLIQKMVKNKEKDNE